MTATQQFSEALAQAAIKWPVVIRHTAPNYQGLASLRKENRTDDSLPVFNEVVIPDGYTIAGLVVWGTRVLSMTLHATV